MGNGAQQVSRKYLEKKLAQMTPKPDTVSLETAATALDVTIYQVHQLVKRRKLKAWVVGGDIEITKESLNNLLMEGD